MNEPTPSLIQNWLKGPIDPESKQEIQELMRSSPAQLEDAFSDYLKFGTGGMRGIMGIGTNRMNLYTVQMATQGLANYLLKQHPLHDRHIVFISYDSRNHSKEFALQAARVLAGNGIGVFLTTDMRPTPYVSFGVRQKACSAGIMITASHNPKEYNGYKVYWNDGAQVVSPHDTGIVDEVKKVTGFDQIKLANAHSPLIELVNPEFDMEYLDALEALQLDPREDHLVGDRLKITYTPLHGTGNKLLPAALRRYGFENINFVDRQIVPDGNFPTVSSPNPESSEALEMGIKQLEDTQSDLLIATDPDADRVGIVVLHKGKPHLLSGNQIACILLEYICMTLKRQEKLLPNSATVTTIVSTPLIAEIAKHYNCACFEVLTGFKYIGELIRKWDEDGSHHFLFGAEESYGYLMGNHSRDKDAIISACLVAEAALLMNVEGRTLIDFLEDIYENYGHFLEKQKVINFAPGSEGMQAMNGMMDTLRKSNLRFIGNHTVIAIEDYEKGYGGLPASNVLLFRFDDGGKLIVRPSGTEPKLKIYACLKQPYEKGGIEVLDKKVDALLDATGSLV